MHTYKICDDLVHGDRIHFIFWVQTECHYNDSCLAKRSKICAWWPSICSIGNI